MAAQIVPHSKKRSKLNVQPHNMFTKYLQDQLRSVIIPFGKLTWQWKMDLLKMYSLLKMRIFHCHVSLLKGINY